MLNKTTKIFARYNCKNSIPEAIYYRGKDNLQMQIKTGTLH